MIVGIGTGRAFQMRNYERRTSGHVLTPDVPGVTLSIGAMFYAGALGLWCFVTTLGNDDAVAHLLCIVRDGLLHAAGAARNYGRP